MSEINNFYFTTAIDDHNFSELTIAPGAYELENLNEENEHKTFEEEYFKNGIYPCVIKPNFSTLDSLIQSNPDR